jgi:hypothetical protein
VLRFERKPPHRIPNKEKESKPRTSKEEISSLEPSNRYHIPRNIGTDDAKNRSFASLPQNFGEAATENRENVSHLRGNRRLPRLLQVVLPGRLRSRANDGAKR